MKSYEGLKLAQVERKVSELRDSLSSSKTSDGWVHLIRKTLGMSMQTLADKLGVDQSSLLRLEKRESQKTITLKKLEEVAQVLDCDLMYALVPKTTFKQKIDDQALEKAKRLLDKAGVHMEIENQKVQSSYEERLNLLKEQLIKNGDIW
jgi:predicted DNA-binding mobile mystery protein A